MNEKMDKDLFYISLFLLAVGIGGQLSYLFFGAFPHTQASFQEMENVSGFALLFGLILLPAGLFKDGLPAPGFPAKVLIGVILIIFVGVTFTGAIVFTGASSKGPTPDYFITIAAGSSTTTSSTTSEWPITFTPQNVTLVIGVNNTVQWTNDDSADHTVTALGSPALFDSHILPPKATFVYQFTKPGVYPYICTLHSWMHGWITVKA
jgi:plastocyanin